MNTNNWMGAVLAVVALLGFLGMLGALMFLKIPPENKEFFNIGFGALIGFAVAAVQYYLGSSAGSAQKTALLVQSANGTAKPTP